MGSEHEERRAVWDEMAPGWDRHRDFMWRTTRHVAEWLVAQIGPRPGDVILDLAGGPGEVGFLAAEAVGASGKVIATDFAPQMVDVARRRAAERGLANVEARVLDAQDVDLPDDAVDGIVCRWGFMLMLDPAAALAESRRVLKDGRRLAFSVWAGPDENPWVTTTGMTLMQMGHEPRNDPFGPGGMFSMSDAGTIRSLVSGAGFDVIEIEEMPVRWEYASFDEAWSFMTEVAGALATVVRQLPPDEVATFRAALEANEEPFRTEDGGLSFPGLTINVCAS
ncbi:MAG TPA: methyltransferase domain-containing protein [Actinomycetota bacterium]|nr:methyltransferase domain-containing protein [Actinomycetota bacterium]